jgi:NAD(P) transhydrogenase subunit alpha
MKIVAIKEKALYEKRVAITPAIVKMYTSLGLEVLVEKGAGESANFSDESFTKAGAQLFTSVAETLKTADILLKVQPTPNKEKACETKLMKKDSVIIGALSPFQNKDLLQEYATNHISSFALELLPRITRAQEMDILSSQSSITGFRAVIDAANHFAKIFPMLVTSAGTIFPAKVLVLGTGVAGLQAIATAKRLGAIVTGFDVREAAKESVESLGAKFVFPKIQNLETKAGYAKEANKNEQAAIQEAIAEQVKKADIVISTALIPGRKPPVLLTKTMIETMRQGSIVVDLVASHGGNCELTKVNEVINHKGITIIGHANYASLVAEDASSLYARNIFNFVKLLYNKEKKTLNIDLNDDIIKATLLTYKGKITQEQFSK